MRWLGVDQLPVHAAGERGLGQTGADAGGDLGHRDRTLEDALRSRQAM
jgi:hypothetical protein